MEFKRQNSVQQKIGCLFEICVENRNSNKRQNQPFSVLASDKLRSDIPQNDIDDAHETEKIDGTCCYISEYEGKPWLWARLDRKPNKSGDRKLKKYLSEKNNWLESGSHGDKPSFTWNVNKDFKDVPHDWIPALNVTLIDGIAQPDHHGHIPGWLPVDIQGRQHLWHLSAVDLQQSLALILRQDADRGLFIDCVPMATLCEQTVELIGTNVNANPYHLGTKLQPVHFLVVHGSIDVTCPRPMTRSSLVDWLERVEGRVEGIVWHCPSGALYKLHRHHVSLKWPVEEPRLSCEKVTINVDGSKFEFNQNEKSQFYLLSKHLGATRAKLCDIHETMYGAIE